MEYCDPLTLPQLHRLQADFPSDGVFLEQGPAERTFIRGTPLFVDDPDETGCLPPLAPVAVTYRPPFVACLKDAWVVGYRTVVSEKRFCNDESLLAKSRERQLANWRSEDPFLNEESRLLSSGEGDRFSLAENGRPHVYLPGTTALLTSHEPSNYGSWLFRALPKIAALQGQPSLTGTKILAYAHSDTTRDSLACVGVPAERLVAHDVWKIYRCDRLLVPCLRNSQGYLDPETRLLFSELRERIWPSGERQRRVYVSRLGQSRRSAHGRVMVNEQELVERLRAAGFDIVEPETLSFEEQVATFASARLVVGPSGSGMFNVAFCAPGTAVIDIESEPHWIHAHLCLFTSCELQFGIFVGRADQADSSHIHRRWSVNIPALLGRIAAIDV